MDFKSSVGQSVKIVEKKCENCHGDGVIKYWAFDSRATIGGYENTIKCPICFGAGYVEFGRIR